MIRALIGNKLITLIVVAIVILAIWKINHGDAARIADTAWDWLNKAADALVNAWHRITSSRNG